MNKSEKMKIGLQLMGAQDLMMILLRKIDNNEIRNLDAFDIMDAMSEYKKEKLNESETSKIR